MNIMKRHPAVLHVGGTYELYYVYGFQNIGVVQNCVILISNQSTLPSFATFLVFYPKTPILPFDYTAIQTNCQYGLPWKKHSKLAI